MAWREDMRREDNGTQYERMTANALEPPRKKPELVPVLAARGVAILEIVSQNLRTFHTNSVIH